MRETRRFGNYKIITKQLKTDKQKANVYKKCIGKLIDEIPSEVRPDWTTFEVIIREEVEPDWNTDESVFPPMRVSTVGIKFESNDYDYTDEELDRISMEVEDEQQTSVESSIKED